MRAGLPNNLAVCTDCRGITEKNLLDDRMLPIWYNDVGNVVYTVPFELSCLREGEKLLIQMVSPYIPLVHIKYGTFGIKGHVCSFPQRVTDVITTLPRLPSDVTCVKMVRHYQKKDGERGTKAFMIRKTVVLNAVRWLLTYNRVYREAVTLDERNLAWMEGEEEKELPDIEMNSSSEGTPPDDVPPDHTDGIRAGSTSGDLGPSPNQTQPPSGSSEVVMTTCGIQVSDVSTFQSEEDRQIASELEATIMNSGKTDDTPRVPWPAVGEEMLSEYDKTGRLFCKAFPWLFPGGEGDICDYHKTETKLGDWVERLLHYVDGRFAKDKMWCFFALNYTTRRRNQTQGRFFVENFYKDSPSSLDELKERIRGGDWRYIEKICYFSNKVRGSAAFWRAKRAELYSWINYHVNEGHGGPTFFITLSCAEYHWPDIIRLLNDRQSHYPSSATAPEKKGKKEAETKDIIRLADDLCIVIQEFFQIRVKEFLDTVGREILGIRHHWLRYELAPSRGQVHAHMLAIADPKVQKFFKQIHAKQKEPDTQAQMLADWSNDLMRLSANLDETAFDKANVTPANNPCRKRYSEVSNHTADENELMRFAEYHVCSEKYCMKTKDSKG
jgi:hypothetical protein